MDYNTFKIDTVQTHNSQTFQIDTVQVGEPTNAAKLLDFSAYDSDYSSFQDHFEPIQGPSTKCL